MEKRDYLLDQVKKIAQLIAALMGGKSVKPEMVNQAIADLTGLDGELFNEPNTASAILRTLHDDNTKALLAQLLRARNPENFGRVCDDVMKNVDMQRLNPDIKALFKSPMGS